MDDPGRPGGEQLVTIWMSDDDPGFPALVSDRRWNGWLSPLFRREVAEAVVDWTNATYARDKERFGDDGSGFRARWDGDEILLIDDTFADDPDYEPTRYKPDSDGRYAVGAWMWCWSAWDSDAADTDSRTGFFPAQDIRIGDSIGDAFSSTEEYFEVRDLPTVDHPVVTVNCRRGSGSGSVWVW
jgi:hypothetical protein